MKCCFVLRLVDREAKKIRRGRWCGCLAAPRLREQREDLLLGGWNKAPWLAGPWIEVMYRGGKRSCFICLLADRNWSRATSS
jgi:hypothetical protein